MRKWIILIVAVAAVGIGYYVVRTNVRVDMPWNQPKFGPVTRGDISVPITASGLIEPLQKIEVKSKASGEVIEVRVQEGDFVRERDVLVLLKKDDERRGFERAEADRDRVRALLEQARIGVLQAEQDVRSAEARLAQLKAEATSLSFNLEKVRYNKSRGGQYSEQELVDATSRYEINQAQQKGADAALMNSQNALKAAHENVNLQAAAEKVALKTLEDAQERLAETTIVSRHAAIVTQVSVRPGNLIQSGTQSFTGGTKVLDLADISRKIVRARVDEAEYGRILKIAPPGALPDMPGLREAAATEAAGSAARLGKVTVTVDAFRDQEFEGVIERVEPQGKQYPGSTIIQFDVHVAITDPEAHLLPLGAQAQVEFTVDQAVNALRVPSEAVKRFREQTGVWIKTAKPSDSEALYGKQFVPCRFGISDGEYTEVLGVVGGGELKEDAQVYTKLPPKSESENEE